jgi:hypothetical protein
MMEKAVNRVLLAFKTWEDRKKDLEPLLKAGAADAQVLARLQLEHLRQAVQHMRRTMRADERPFLLLLNSQVRKLEKQLYPNLLRRLISQIKNRLLDGPAYLKQQRMQRDTNLESLKLQLREAGLGSLAGKLENHLSADQNVARLPLVCQLGPEKRLSLDLHFERDGHHNFQLHRISGNLFEQGVLSRSQHFNLADWPNLKTNQIWSLLEGRALKQHYTNASGQENQRWIELGTQGIQSYDPEYAFDVRTALADLPAITRNREELINYLENGQQVSTHWKQGRAYQTIYVQADPANRCIKIFDEKLQPTTVEKLNQRMAQQACKVKTLQVPRQQPKKRIKTGQHQ